MAILKTDARFRVDSLIAIARATTSPSMRESLLAEALEVLRSGEIPDDTYGIESFFSIIEPSSTYVKASRVFEMYTQFCLDNGYRVIMRKKLCERLAEEGFREGIRDGYRVFFIKFKEA